MPSLLSLCGLVSITADPHCHSTPVMQDPQWLKMFHNIVGLKRRPARGGRWSGGLDEDHDVRGEEDHAREDHVGEGVVAMTNVLSTNHRAKERPQEAEREPTAWDV